VHYNSIIVIRTSEFTRFYWSRNHGPTRQLCYVQKMLSNCFLQLCAPWWWAHQAWYV